MQHSQHDPLAIVPNPQFARGKQAIPSSQTLITGSPGVFGTNAVQLTHRDMLLATAAQSEAAQRESRSPGTAEARQGPWALSEHDARRILRSCSPGSPYSSGYRRLSRPGITDAT